MHDLKKPLALLAILALIVLCAYFWSTNMGKSTSETDSVVRDDFVPGPPSPEIVEMLEKSRGFEVLISYTDAGFEPAEANIKSGESIRFTNNSDHELWVAAVGSGELPQYPGMSDCGGSSLDTCKVLQPRDFWEFTFTESGTWTFQNNLDKGQTGIVEVQVQ